MISLLTWALVEVERSIEVDFNCSGLQFPFHFEEGSMLKEVFLWS
jgi:hypothetical protein